MGLLSNITKSSSGKTLAYQTGSTKNYLDFIEKLDYQKYEIINITKGTDWYVTYKLKE